MKMKIPQPRTAEARYAPVQLFLMVMGLVLFPLSQLLVGRHPTLPGFLAGFSILSFIYVMDLKWSPGAKRNFDRMRSRRLTSFEIHGSAVWVITIALLPTVLLGSFYRGTDVQPRSVLELAQISGWILLAMALGELAFTLVHKNLLHRKGFARHWWHHCSLESSISSTYWFDPLDVLCEFSLPVGILIGTTLLAGDFRVYYWGVAVIMTWYAMDHDSVLRLPHWHHHKNIDQHYSVYIPAAQKGGPDRVKKELGI